MLRKHSILIILLFASFYLQANHTSGGMIINYRSLESVNGNKLEYEVTVYSLFDTSISPTPSANLTVKLSSTCYPDQNLIIPHFKNNAGSYFPIKNFGYCISNNNFPTSLELTIFKDTLILPGVCTNFKFSISTPNAYSLSTNISTPLNSYYFVTLNNTKGPNSNPQVNQSDIMQISCLLNPLKLYDFIEEDGDSVVYTSSVPQVYNNLVVSNANFSAGYSVSNPVNSPTGYSVDPLTGIVNTSLNQQGQYAVAIKYQEYRLDTALGVKVQISKGRYIMYLFGSSNCNLIPININHTLSVNSDSLQCGEKFIQIRTTRKAEISTLTSSGSEFNIISGKNPNLTVIGAQFLSDTVIKLELNQTLVSNDTVSLTIANGSDTNTILSICGKEILAYNDTLLFYSTIANSINPQFSYSTNLLEVDFTSSMADSVVWNFGDGTPILINSLNPKHLFTSPGTYNVMITLFNKCGDSWSSNQAIVICDSINAKPNYTLLGDTLFFGSISHGADFYYWDFGDGNVSLNPSGIHIYSTKGNFEVVFKTKNNCGDSSIQKTMITNCQKAMADWSYQILNININGMDIFFNSVMSPNVSRYIWDFGDGGKDSLNRNPVHSYSSPSLSYSVSLTVFNACSNKTVREFRLDQIGVEEITSINAFEVYPNPAADQLIIEWDPKHAKDISITIYSMEGKELLKKEILNGEVGQLKINVKQFRAGCYTIQIKTTNGMVNKKILFKG